MLDRWRLLGVKRGPYYVRGLSLSPVLVPLSQGDF